MAGPSADTLSARTILITKPAGGIGGAPAGLCAERDATLVLVDAAEVAAIERRVGDLGSRASLHRCDVSRRDAVAELAAAAGPVDGLLDCVAICPDDD